MNAFADKRPLRIFAALALPLAVMAACSDEGATTQYEFQPTKSIQVDRPDAPGDVTKTVLTQTGPASEGVDGGITAVSMANDEPIVTTNSGMLLFDTDNDVVSAPDINMVQQYAAYLTSHPETTLMISGHADERGTRTHNADLSLRRAQQVAGLLVSMGVPQMQLKTRAFGEDQPVGDPRNWAENRRVELSYSNESQLSSR